MSCWTDGFSGLIWNLWCSLVVSGVNESCSAVQLTACRRKGILVHCCCQMLRLIPPIGQPGWWHSMVQLLEMRPKTMTSLPSTLSIAHITAPYTLEMHHGTRVAGVVLHTCQVRRERERGRRCCSNTVCRFGGGSTTVCLSMWNVHQFIHAAQKKISTATSPCVTCTTFQPS